MGHKLMLHSQYLGDNSLVISGKFCCALGIVVLNSHIKGTRILFQYLFLMEKSILYAKIAVSEIFFFSKTQF